MANSVLKFVVGRDDFPVWFNDECSKGRAKINFEKGRVKNVIVYSPTKTFTANIGDVIILYNSGMSVIPSDKAVKYGVKNEETNKKTVQ